MSKRNRFNQTTNQNQLEVEESNQEVVLEDTDKNLGTQVIEPTLETTLSFQEETLVEIQDEIQENSKDVIQDQVEIVSIEEQVLEPVEEQVLEPVEEQVLEPVEEQSSVSTVLKLENVIDHENDTVLLDNDITQPKIPVSLDRKQKLEEERKLRHEQWLAWKRRPKN